MTTLSDTQDTKEVIDALLDELPPESLTVVRQFVEFLRQQAQQGHPIGANAEAPQYRYPNAPTPAATLQAWTELLDEGYEGDALADAEALYDGD
jgi:hypothetical protein